jgi:hypothetical protein
LAVLFGVEMGHCKDQKVTGLHVWIRRPEDIQKEFERYGEVRDVYIPKDFYTKYVTTAGRAASEKEHVYNTVVQ